MAESKTFMMGNFEAHLPVELRYAKNHMWCRPGDEVLQFGFTSYAVRLMQDVYFLDWIVDAGATVEAKQHIGHIETSKAQSDLFAPIAGNLVEWNEELLKDPTPINVDTYGPGWLFTMQGDVNDTMSVDEYYQHLDDNWEKTQRMLKGHM